jgi:hypothetical protein
MISINGTTIRTPDQQLNEREDLMQTTYIAIDGSKQRNYVGRKKAVTLAWSRLTPAEYQQILALLNSGSSTVVYLNNASNRAGGTFTFTGLATVAEQDYIRGGTLLRGLSAEILEA